MEMDLEIGPSDVYWIDLVLDTQKKKALEFCKTGNGVQSFSKSGKFFDRVR
jgi:hypothetical protein